LAHQRITINATGRFGDLHLMNMQSEVPKFRNMGINRNIWLIYVCFFFRRRPACVSGHQMSVAVEIKTFGILFDFDVDY